MDGWKDLFFILDSLLLFFSCSVSTNVRPFSAFFFLEKRLCWLEFSRLESRVGVGNGES
jgi:hypothetical protein